MQEQMVQQHMPSQCHSMLSGSCLLLAKHHAGSRQLQALTHLSACWLLQETLQQMVQQLDICQRALSDFLEEKRSMFPRFYFIGDDDLLEVRGRSAVCLL